MHSFDQMETAHHHYDLSSYRQAFSVAYLSPPHHHTHLPPFHHLNGVGNFEHEAPGGSSYRHESQALREQQPTPPYDGRMGGGEKEADAVAQALEIARESADGAGNATISRILENALQQLWAKVMANPDSYVLTRNEFAVFNFYQHRYVDNKIARAARRRYWDSTTATSR